LKDIREFVMAAAQEAGLSRKAAYRLRLGVDEVSTNIIEHGYADAAERTSEEHLYLSAAMTADTLKITIEDRGHPYDPHQTPPLDDFTLPLEHRRTGGLGLYLTLHGIDSCSYERDGEWNRVTFVMHRE
jgi:anti-sigma regulatory factor (Ser/Thr protein kinase)